MTSPSSTESPTATSIFHTVPVMCALISGMPEIKAHITGTVWKIEVAVGDSVDEGDVIAILESMKMEMPVETDDEGTVKEIRVKEGQPVAEGDVIAVVE